MLAALTGTIDSELFVRDPEAVLAAKFVPPAFDWVDPRLADAEREHRLGLVTAARAEGQDADDAEEAADA